jgi:predicted amidohydrolase
MTSKPKELTVATLQLRTENSYNLNLEKILTHIHSTEAQLIVAPELCLTDFDYENFEDVAGFYETAVERLLDAVSTQTLLLTMTKKEGNSFVNQAVVIHNHQIIYQQNKYKLFTLGEETRYFTAGLKEDIATFSINGISYGLLICFELRFKELWRRLEGVDIVLIPARWGKPRKRHLEVLSEALAIMNQTFVVVSNSADDDMASSSAIITPWGESYRDDSLEMLQQKLKLNDVKKIRRMVKMN